ncbi:MAG: trypsin-like peptidase domain-containing protein [Desulfobacterales bacterium]|nr:trypsin-like peptidase domain-containing protein [Desulfobacterales bacterium]
MLNKRTPKEFELRLRDSNSNNIDYIAEHPIFTQESENNFLSTLWKSTCRVFTKDGTGSGFFVNTSEGIIVITNAHVVNGYSDVFIEWIKESMVYQLSGSLIAIDYPHDLALIKPEENQEIESFLEIGESPLPGTPVWICGFPFGSETPRFSKGIISGYQCCETFSCEISSVVVDVSVNPGNSGGPVCSSDGKVVGIVHAFHISSLYIPKLLFDDLNEDMQNNLKIIKNLLRYNVGICYALDPIDIKDIITTRSSWAIQTINRTFNKYPPKILEIMQKDFVNIQISCLEINKKPKNCSSIGVFSYSPDGKIFLGWSTDSSRIELDVCDTWKEIILKLSHNGGSFILQGYDILLYRSKYKGFINPIRIKIKQEQEDL